MPCLFHQERMHGNCETGKTSNYLLGLWFSRKSRAFTNVRHYVNITYVMYSIDKYDKSNESLRMELTRKLEYLVRSVLEKFVHTPGIREHTILSFLIKANFLILFWASAEFNQLAMDIMFC